VTRPWTPWRSGPGLMFLATPIKAPLNWMPLPIALAHRLARPAVPEFRKKSRLIGLPAGPTCKTQVTVQYDGTTPVRLEHRPCSRPNTPTAKFDLRTRLHAPTFARMSSTPCWPDLRNTKTT